MLREIREIDPVNTLGKNMPERDLKFYVQLKFLSPNENFSKSTVSLMSLCL